MKILIIFLTSATILATAGCKTARKDDGNIRASKTVIDRIDPPNKARPTPTPAPPSNVIAGSDKIYFVGGAAVARRETDARVLQVSPEARRLIVGNGPEGDPTFQPALLEPELAFELAKTREQYAYTKNMMERMAVTNGQQQAVIQDLAAQNKALLEKIEQIARYAKQLEEKNSGKDPAKK